MTFNKTTFLAALALLCVAQCPARADDTKPQLVASLTRSSNPVDPALERAINLIIESQKARETQMRRQNIKPAKQEHIVRTHTDLDGKLILGGSESIPM